MEKERNDKQHNLEMILNNCNLLSSCNYLDYFEDIFFYLKTRCQFNYDELRPLYVTRSIIINLLEYLDKDKKQ